MSLFDTGPLPAQAEQLYAAMPCAGVSAGQCDLASPCAILIGGEGQGVRTRLRGAALDVQILAGILLHEARRQRMPQ